MTAETRTGTAPAGPAPLPLTDSQKGLLVVDGRIPTKEIYNQVMRLDLDPQVPAGRVAEALATLVTIQPSMRQVFGLVPEMHARLVPPPEPTALPLERVEVAPERYEETVTEWAVRISRARFALTEQPPWRSAYLRTTDGARAALLVTMHHIIGDGVSIGPVVRDLESALAGGSDPAEITELRLTREAAFVRELQAQNRVASAPRTAERAKIWAERLREVPAQVLCPRPNRPIETGFTGARVAWQLTQAETDAFAAAGRRLGVTPFVLLNAVYSAVIARHTGMSTVLIGSPFMARRTVGAFDLCGFFVNTLPVTVEVDWTRPFDQHADAHVREAVDYCRANVDVAFNQLVAHVRPDRSTNRNPLFSCMLAMQDTVDAKPAGIIQGVSEPGNGTAKFDLWLGATPVDGRWLLELEYDRQLIPPAVADGLRDSLRTALRRALADGSRPLADLFVDSSPVASHCTDGYPAEVPAATLSEWLAQPARSRPDAVAIEDQTGQLTYQQLAAASEELAAGLTRAGVRARDVVGVCPQTLSETTTVILAVLRCGAAYLPLDPGLPADRLQYMIDKAGVRLTVGDLPLAGARSVRADQLRTAPDQPAARHPEPAPDPAAPGYVMFTSGSTGLPKGVSMGQGPLLNLTAWQVGALQQDGQTRFLQYAPLGFDVSFQEIVPTLVAGGTVVSREPADRRDFPALVRRVADAAATHVYLPVAALRPLVQHARGRGVRFPELRYLCVSGEQLLIDEEIRAFFADHPHCTLVNLYGPTETHAVTTYRLTATDPQWPVHVPIGRPLAGVRCYVVDVTGHLAPAGVPGQLYLGGRCPANGYIGDPERTAASFRPDRFAGGDARMYATGDQVLRDADGQLIFLGRDDSQVKVRGYRIELGEIEAAANAVPGVRQAVAAARGTGVERELVLFLLPEGQEAVDPAQVRERLATALPDYMVPARTFELESVPTTGTGKTDRDALVALADRLVGQARIGEAGPDTVEYADEIEREIAGLWSEVLQVPAVARDRPVVEYGAHSLNIFTVLAQVEQRYGVAPPVVDFFRSPTVATLAELVRTERAEEDAG